MRSAFEVILIAASLVACGGAGSPAPASPSPVTDRAVDFLVVSTTSQSGHQDEPARIAVQQEGDRLRISVHQGLQRTGGFSIRVTKVERSRTTLRIHASFNEPGPGAIVTMALTSPAHVVSIAKEDAAGLRDAVLVDQRGAERARAPLP